ncbi:hypothetical protein DYB38_012343 [Aphanomyces astaci]|uniref:Uncharacterized protein n=1 Tax=Aphanomyces astaci TaxID=112090 RepID=A0A397C7K9_APHAT|nr:hypothetical protein DYB38_012343 [Aphanomyces astaci]
MSLDVGTTTQTLSDKTLARRRYFREKQREYRRKLNANGAAMQAEVVHLQLILDGFQVKSLPSVREASDSMLSWHSIAMVFKSEAHRVLTDRESLVTQTKEFRALIASMQRFVMMNIPVTEEVVANTRLFCTTTTDGAFMNTLHGHFVEADRFVMVLRHVEDDEAHACYPMLRQRHYRSWTEVRQVSPTHIIMQTVSHMSRSFRAYDGVVSSDELAVLCGIDVTGIEDDDQKEAYVRRELIRLANAHFLLWRQRFTALMQELSQQQ